MSRIRNATLAAALILCPFAAQAEGGFYGSMRIGLQYADAGGDSDAQINFRNWASRMGFSGSTDLENGLTGFGKIEFGIDTGSSANGNGALATRLAYVGLKGDFGTLTLGQDYHTWYNTIIAPVDQPWWGSCNGCVSYTGRSENGLTYSNTFGSFSASGTVYMRDAVGETFEEDVDGIELGVSFAVDSLTIGLGYQDWDNGTDGTLGVSVKGSAGSLGYAANIVSQNASSGGEDALGIDIYVSVGNTYMDVGLIDRDDQTMGITLGQTVNIGKDTTAWFELGARDSDADGANSSFAVRSALKYDWK